MRKLTHAMAAAALVTTAVGGFATATATQAFADPPCGSTSANVGVYTNMTYRNCLSVAVAKRPYARGLPGYVGECKVVHPGAVATWIGLPRPAIGGYVGIDCY